MIKSKSLVKKNFGIKSTMRYPLLGFLILFCFNQSYGQVEATKGKPAKEQVNIVLIIADQFRADACKREGFELNTTPFLDSLAETGTWFNKAYCASPACIPSRTSMITGRFPSATKVRSNMNLTDVVYKTDLFDVVKSKGYATALIGKNHTYLKPQMLDYWKEYSHLGVEKPKNQEERDFNKYLVSTNFYMDKQPAPFVADMQQPSRMVNDAENWVDSQKRSEKPFFLYLSFPEPHNPYQVSEPYYSMFPPETLPDVLVGKEALKEKGNKWVLQKELMGMGYPNFEKNIPRIRSNYYGMMRLIDDQVKRFVDHLKKTRSYENTIFIFVADHGDFTGEYGLIKKGVEVPECLARIPMLWHGPEIIKNKKPSDAHVSNVDIMPTICNLLNVPLPDGVQGRSLWPLLSGQKYPKEEFSSVIVQQGFGGLHFTDLQEYDPYTQDGTLVKGKEQFDELNTWSQSGMMRMLRKDDWKLVYDMQGSGQLYNLATDPAEVHNLFGSSTYKDKQMELLSNMMTWELRTQDPLPLPNPNKNRHYGFKKDPYNYWTPYKNEPQQKLRENLKKLKDIENQN